MTQYNLATKNMSVLAEAGIQSARPIIWIPTFVGMVNLQIIEHPTQHGIMGRLVC